jgi:1-acyl-sn-glycerol-3-phosphate acyltransferase
MGAAVGLLGSLLAKLPCAALRAVLWLLTYTLYRLRVERAENIPAERCWSAITCPSSTLCY